MKLYIVCTSLECQYFHAGDHLGEKSGSKIDPLKKSVTLNRTLHKNQRSLNGPFTKIKDLKTDPKIKNYNHTRSAASEYLLEND